MEYNFDSALSALETNTIGAFAPIITPADLAFAIYVNDFPIPFPTSIVGANKISTSPDTSLLNPFISLASLETAKSNAKGPSTITFIPN